MFRLKIKAKIEGERPFGRLLTTASVIFGFCSSCSALPLLFLSLNFFIFFFYFGFCLFCFLLITNAVSPCEAEWTSWSAQTNKGSLSSLRSVCIDFFLYFLLSCFFPIFGFADLLFELFWCFVVFPFFSIFMSFSRSSSLHIMASPNSLESRPRWRFVFCFSLLSICSSCCTSLSRLSTISDIVVSQWLHYPIFKIIRSHHHRSFSLRGLSFVDDEPDVLFSSESCWFVHILLF